MMFIPSLFSFLVLLQDFTAAKLAPEAPIIERSELQLLRSYRVNSPDHERFDLSGLIALSPSLKYRFQISGDYLFINDKTSWVYIGTILPAQGRMASEIQAVRWIDLHQFADLPSFDIEDIASDGERIFVANEPDGTLFEIKAGAFKSGSKYLVKLHRWKNPFAKYPLSAAFGIEALAIKNGDVWLGKEMPPLAFFKMNLKTDQVTLVRMARQMGSLTAARFDSKFSYQLDRENRCIWKSADLEKDRGSCLSFQKTIDNDDFRYRVIDDQGTERPEWSTAEGLDLVGNTFVVVTDNNDLPLKANPKEKRPSLMVFQIPR